MSRWIGIKFTPRRTILAVGIVCIIVGVIWRDHKNQTASLEVLGEGMTPRKYVDLFHIKRDYMNNIEAIRLRGIHETDSTKYRSFSIYRPVGGFYRYSTDWISYKQGVDKVMASPSRDIIKVYLDHLFYNEDSLLCTGLVVVEYPNYNQTEKRKYTAYDGYLLLGQRKDINEKFKIYVYERLQMLGHYSKEGMTQALESTYLKKRKNVDLPYIISDKRFFEKSPLFEKTSEGTYIFEHDLSIAGRIGRKLLLYSNDDERPVYLEDDTVFIPYRSHMQWEN